MYRGINAVRDGGRIGDIGAAIQSYAIKVRPGRPLKSWEMRALMQSSVSDDYEGPGCMPNLGKAFLALSLGFASEKPANREHYLEKFDPPSCADNQG